MEHLLWVIPPRDLLSNFCIGSFRIASAASRTEEPLRLNVHLACAGHHHPFFALHLCADQVWQRRVGCGLGAVRKEERFAAQNHHPRCHPAHGAHHHHLPLLLQVS